MQALIVDDSRTIRKILATMLHTMGFQIIEAADGSEALSYLKQQQPPDVALIDWHMPAMDGIDLIRHMRQNAAWSKVRIVMVTREADLEHIQIALDAGADEYVMKPFDADVIHDKMSLLGLIQIP